MGSWKLDFPYYRCRRVVRDDEEQYAFEVYTLGFFSYWFIRLIHGKARLEEMAAGSD